MPAKKVDNHYVNGGFWERVLAGIIDSIVLGFVIIPFSFLIMSLSVIYPNVSQNQLLLPVSLSIILIIYNVVCLSAWGQTLGKKALSLKVIGKSANRITFPQALMRETVGKWISKFVFGLGYLWILIDPDRRGWHDKIAKTQVVKVDEKGNALQGANPPITILSKIVFIFLGFILAIYTFIQFLVFFYILVAQPFQVKGNTMEPTLRNNQYILINKFGYQLGLPKRGDIILFRPPKDETIVYIKRIIAIPGDRLRIENGKVYVNGKALVEPYLVKNNTTSMFYGQKLQEGQTVTIPGDNYFVLGDNREHSSDSREFGTIKKESIVGKFWFRYL